MSFCLSIRDGSRLSPRECGSNYRSAKGDDYDESLPMNPSPSPLSRRKLLHQLGGGLGVLGAADVLSQRASAAAFVGQSRKACHFVPKAKRVIHLFMNGGPFQADLFDPKPALKTYAGQRPEGADLLTERPTGGLLPSPFRFQPVR